MKKAIYLSLLLVLLILFPFFACDENGDGNDDGDVPVINSFISSVATVAMNVAVTLSWDVSGADTVTIDNGIGDVQPQDSTQVTFTAVGIYTYTLTATNSYGSSTASVTITCQENPPVQTGKIVDHNCLNITQIPAQYLNLAKTNLTIHYAHTSHGDQMLLGLDLVEQENAGFESEYADCALPTTANVLRILNGNPEINGNWWCETYITPDYYWSTQDGLNWVNAIVQNTGVNVSMWMWCTQQDDNTYEMTQQYLNAMASLEAANPAITFVYCTGNADNALTNRYERNLQVRNFCQANNKWLFDFEDIECWYNGVQYYENGVPTRDPHYADDGYGGHTNAANCRNKGKAFWWIMAEIAGWDGE